MPVFAEYLSGIRAHEFTMPPYILGNDKEKYESSLIKISEILNLFEITGGILDSNNVPTSLVAAFYNLVNEFDSQQLSAFKIQGNDSAESLNRYRQAMDKLDMYYTRFFEISSSNTTLPLVNSINIYKFQDAVNIDARASNVIQEFDATRKTLDSTIAKLAAESAKKVITNYAEIFEKQEAKHKTESDKWLNISILTSVVFLLLFILSTVCEWFPIKTKLSDYRDGHVYINEVFNIPILVSKIVVISFILFLISFCFRQYAINKNLQVINEQRKNAIDSYELFAASAGGDNIAKNALLSQLARSIYQTTHTGFLSGKQSDPANNQMFELTRFIQGGEK